MKNITKIIISTFLVILLANGALGFPGYGGNSTATNSNITNTTDIPQNTGTIPQIDLTNATESDQDIIIVQHLIELDADRLKAENKLFIRETLIFRNIGTKDFFGDLRAWVPDGSEDVIVARSGMMTGGENVPINFSQNGNIISWKDYVEQNSSLPFLYVLEYTVQQKAAGTISSAKMFSKKLAVPTLTSYKYVENPNIGAALVVKITKPAGNTVQFTDENGNKIAATDVNETAGIFRFSSPEFKEINVELSPSSLPASASQNYAAYIVIGILIILALLYPYIKKKLKSDKKDKDTSEKNRTKATKINKREEIEKPSEADSPVSSGKYDGKKANELLDIKKQLLSRMKDLEKKYESGDLLDEDYEDKRKSYQDNLKEIEEKLKKMG
ncbi:hypothetical protein METP3_00692 [Methanosarcinales archaeon]|nr:hypothetical protein METP3_00692 [Methanosarcinales archaeon]